MTAIHNVATPRHGEVCMTLHGSAEGAAFVISPTLGAHRPTLCTLSEDRFATSPPQPFRNPIGTELAVRVAERILELDSVSSARLKAGRIVSVSIPSAQPTSVTGNPSNLEELRRRVHAIGATVRPTLLTVLSNTPPLHAYQTLGVNWLVDRRAAILADDMGLGKTAQAISALRLSFHSAPLNTALIVCPKHLMANWESELAKWAPELSWSRLAPPPRWRAQGWKMVFNRLHVLITNYEHLPALVSDEGVLHFSTVVLDEAHRVRNASTRTTEALRTIDRDHTWALSGTPLERSAHDLWTLLSVVEPRRFSLANMPRSAEAVKARARSYVLRRMKSTHLPGLPAEVTEHETIDLLPKQAQAYQDVLDGLKDSIGATTLTTLARLRMLCDLDPITGESAKLNRIVDILDDMSLAGGKAVVFSHFLAPLDNLATRLAHRDIGYVHLRGDMGSQSREHAIASFKEDGDIPVILASTQVAGEGLNLVEANHVVFVNRWWNPSANAQAKDRVARMGQRRMVVIHSFTCRNTIEEHLDELLAAKMGVTKDIMEGLADPMGDAAVAQEVVRRLLFTSN